MPEALNMVLDGELVEDNKRWRKGKRATGENLA